jgi:hypothetical protein
MGLIHYEHYTWQSCVVIAAKWYRFSMLPQGIFPQIMLFLRTDGDFI